MPDFGLLGRAMIRLRARPQMLTVTQSGNWDCLWTHDVIMMRYLSLHVAAKLKMTGAGCYIGHVFALAFAHADNSVISSF